MPSSFKSVIATIVVGLDFSYANLFFLNPITLVIMSVFSATVMPQEITTANNSVNLDVV